MKCPGLHCDGCGGGGGLVLAVIVLTVIGAAAYHVRHGIETGLQIAMWTIVGAVSLAAIGGAVYAAVRIRARVLEARARRTVPAPVRLVRLGPLSQTPVPNSPPGGQFGTAEWNSQAIEAPRQHPASWPLPGHWQEINPRTDRRTSS